MEKSTKKELAVAFLNELASMQHERLQGIVEKVIGEELAAIMFNYARQVLQANPDKAVENASSMLILGYLIRVYEEGEIPAEHLPV